MLYLGTEMPRGGTIAQRMALKRANKEATRVKMQEVTIHMTASSSETSPLDLSEPNANTDFLNIPCTPVAPTNHAATEVFYTPAATVTEAGAVELPPSAYDEAEDDQNRPKHARKSSVIMNVGEFPTNFKRKKEELVVACKAICDEKVKSTTIFTRLIT